MNAPFKRAGLGLACSIALLLAACGSSSSTPATSGPSLDVNLSTPGLQAILEVGDNDNYYAYFTGATSETIASGGNADNLPLTLDQTGSTGKLNLAPLTSTIPGIYGLIINAVDSGGTSVVTFDANVYPLGNLSGHPTILTFTPDATQASTSTVSGTVTIANSPVRNGLDLVVGGAQLIAPAGTSGITINSTTITPVTVASNPDAVTFSAYITVTRNSVTPGSVKPQTVTDASGNSYSHGVEMSLTAVPPSNGLSVQPYTELVYVDNLSTL